MNNFEERIALLTDEQKALLQRRLKSKTDRQDIHVVNDQTNIDDDLSFPQKRLWFLSQLEPESPVYNIPSAFLLLGELDIAVLQTCLNEVASRHEILRTFIVEDGDGEPKRKVIPVSDVAMPFIDLIDESKEMRRQERSRIVGEEIQRPFHLHNTSLWRVLLLRLDHDEHYLVITMHHLIFDGWSVTVLLQELSELYAAFIHKAPSPLPQLALQYSDYVSWQKKNLSDVLLQKQLVYWKKALEGSSPVLELPATYMRPSVQTFKGSSYVFELSKSLSDRLKTLCNSEESTVFMAMLSVFNTLLYRYTGQEDIIIGVPISGRNQSEFQHLIGVFVNTLPIRTKFSGEISFRKLLQLVREASLEAFSHQDVPFETIVQNVQPDRSASINPLFQVLFTYQKAVPNFYLDQVLMNYQPIDGGTAKFDLSLDILDGGDLYPPKCILEYNTDLFDREFIERMARHFEMIVENVVSDPDRYISDIYYLTDAEKELMNSWEGPTLEYPQNENICTWFERQVEKNDEAIAIVYQEEHLTYGELNERANRFASFVLKQKAENGNVIGICLPKSVELVIAVLGVLKAGKAYLPMDPLYPPDRLYHMISDSKVCTVITNHATDHLDLTGLNVDTIVMDSQLTKEQLSRECSKNKEISLSPDSLAYVIYTSGSTGLPKGTMVSHSNLAHAFQGWEHDYRLTDDTSAHLQMASFSFDVCVGDIVRALCSGSKLVLCPPDLLLEPQKLYQLMVNQQIDCAEFVPTVIRSLMQYLEESNQRLDFMELVIVGSDTWKMDEYQRLRSYCGEQTRIINSYGLTEATIDSSYFEYTNKQAVSNKSVPIGRPFPNTQLLVLDAHRQAVPVGVAGELYISGNGVAQGYIHKPELTSERFISLPAEPGHMKRAYKTGDMARYLPDGNIELMGRSDFQIKLRGYRIELSEIEKNILQFPGISQSIVIVREDNSDLKYLVAYVICDKESTVSTHAVKDYLKNKLPDYMVPTMIVVLESFPLTNNGKINRMQLPVPNAAEWNVNTAYMPAQTLTEEILVDIWKEVFGASRIGVNDDFFQLGGYSLLAMKITAQVRKIFSVELPLQALFQSPTVAGLAGVIASLQGDSQREGESKQSLPVIIPDLLNRYEPFPLTDIQHAYWIGRNEVYELGNVATHSYDEYEAQFLDIHKFESAWNSLIRRHDMLRTVVTPNGLQQVFSEVPYYSMDILDLRGRPIHEADEAVKATRQDMSHQMLETHKWPVFDIRVTLLDEHKSLIHFSTDALMWDVWSFVILMKELVIIYQGKENELTPLDISFRDYVMALTDFKTSDKYKESLEYWKQRVHSLPVAPELPLSQSPKSLIKPHFVRYHTKLDFKSWNRLKTKAMKVGITTTGILLAAFSEVLGQWSKSPDFSLNLTFLNRNAVHPQVNDIVGEFTSVILLAVMNSGNATFIERARKIQADLWNDLENHHISGIQVLRELTTIKGGAFEAKMPVVFTSALVVPVPDEREMPFPIKPVEDLGVTQTSQVWLDCGVWDDRNGLYCNWDVVEDIYPPGFIKNMFDAYWSLVHRLADEDEVWNQGVISLVPQEQIERREKLNTRAEGVSHDLLHSLFNLQAVSQPDYPAIVSMHKRLNYDDVYKLSNKIGRYLRLNGVRPNQLVAIIMEKGWEQIVGVLGILQSGAAYVPIDPALPKERISYLLEYTKVKYVLTQSNLISHLDLSEDMSVCEVNEQFLSEWSDEALETIQKPEDLAYVIFTSGSTGVPKGVMINHSGAVNTILDINEKFNLTQKDRVLALSALHFDLSVFDIFGSLAAGASIIVPDEVNLLNPTHWQWLMNTEHVSVWNSVPALMGMFTDHLLSAKERCGNYLRLIMLSGDWIPVSLPGVIRSLSQAEAIISLGGATEASIWSVYYPINEVASDWKSIPYGKPLSNQTVHILNSFMEPCPDWVTGNIYIGGNGLAEGYWGDEIKTNESFQYHSITRERLYRTGDLGRYLPDGNIEFIGREDLQLKVQGYRIELSEIENALLRYPTINDVVVVSVGEQQMYKKLVAFYIPKRGEAIKSRDLRRFLIERLPEYMVPKSYIEVDTFPLTTNSKVDRQLLKENVDWTKHVVNNYQEPRTEMEREIASIWSGLLEYDRPGVYDNFHELGGDSLQSITFLTKIRDLYQIDYPLRELLQNFTIEEIAAYLEEQLGLEPKAIEESTAEGKV